jgi:predicted RNA-binding protein with TRAM domain
MLFLTVVFRPFPFDYHQELTLQVEDLTNLGLGVARHTLADGQQWVVMIPLALPGETVKVKVFRNYKSYSEADLVEVLTSSPDRVKPECEYFEICGGCQYQHLSVPAQREWKKVQVDTVLKKIGGLSGVVVNDVVGTKEHYHYRTKITPHYDAPKKVSDLKIGFQKRGTRIMVDIPKCIIATESINDKYIQVRSDLHESMKVKLPKKGATLLFRGKISPHASHCILTSIVFILVSYYTLVNYMSYYSLVSECEEGVATDHRAVISQRVDNVLFRFKAGEFFQVHSLHLTHYCFSYYYPPRTITSFSPSWSLMFSHNRLAMDATTSSTPTVGRDSSHSAAQRHSPR